MIARGVVVSKLANKQACNATKTFEKSHLTYYVTFFLLWQNLKFSNLENLKNALANQKEFKWQKIPVADGKKDQVLYFYILPFQFLL